MKLKNLLWKSKKDYLENLQVKFKYEQMKLLVMETLNKDSFTPLKMKQYFYVQLNAEPWILDYITENLSDELFIHINDYELDLDYTDIFNIINAIDDIAKHKKQRMSDESSEYFREIEQIKKNADKLQSLSKDDLEIELPRLPFQTYFMLMEYFKCRGALSEDTIKDISLFFKKRMPKGGNAKNERLADLNDLKGGKIIEEMMKGTSTKGIRNIINSNNFAPQNEINEAEVYRPSSKDK